MVISRLGRMRANAAAQHFFISSNFKIFEILYLSTRFLVQGVHKLLVWKKTQGALPHFLIREEIITHSDSWYNPKSMQGEIIEI